MLMGVRLGGQEEGGVSGRDVSVDSGLFFLFAGLASLLFFF